MKYLESDVMCIYACTCVMNFTLPVPRMNEMRFRQIGNRIMIMLKLMGSAGPRANARASYVGEIIAVNLSILYIASLIPRPPLLAFTIIHGQSPAPVYYYECKWKINTGEGWE